MNVSNELQILYFVGIEIRAGSEGVQMDDRRFTRDEVLGQVLYMKAFHLMVTL